MKRFFSSCWILIAAGAAISTASFSACDDDKDNTPVYEPVEMTVCTQEEATEKEPPYGTLFDLCQLVFFSETFPFRSLQNATLTICPLSEKRLFLADRPRISSSEEYPNMLPPTSTVSFWDFLDMEQFPNIDYIFAGKKGYMSQVFYYLPKESGNYDFYFRIDCPEKGLYFQTPNYRYTMRLIEGGLYDASITTLE